MELNLEQEHIRCYRMVLDTEVCREETMEAIVPDACPDIARIVDTGGQICLTGKQVRESGVTVSGTVMGWVLYRPEEGGQLCRMEVKLPFTVQAEGEPLPSQVHCVVGCSLHSMDARALNPRKILVRADLAVTVQGLVPEEMTLCRSITGDGAEAVEQQQVTHMVYLTTGATEKEFTFYDELHLSAGPAGNAQVASIRAEPRCTESRIIGNKLIFKGEALLQIRYLVGAELCSMRYSMPFSQIMELDGAGETTDHDLTLCLTGAEWTQMGEGGRTLNITLELLGQAVIRDSIPVTVLQDCYSTAGPMRVQQEYRTLDQRQDRSVRPQTVRELLETDTPVKTVIDACVSVCGTQRQRQENKELLQTQLRVHVLYLDEGDEPQVLDRTITVSEQFGLPAHGTFHYRCHGPGEVLAIPAAGGAEVRLELEHHCLVVGQNRVPVVVSAVPERGEGETRPRQPSVVLRMAAPGEDLWDMAKSCYTTQDRIRKANSLGEDDPIPVGQMLLIPGVR